MRAGISTASLFMREENEEALSRFAEWKIDCAEVFLTTYSQYNREYGERLSRCKGGVQINSVHDLTSQFEPQLFSRHSLVRADAYRFLEGVLSAAQALGAPYFSFHGTTRAKKASREAARDNLENIGEELAALSSFCSARGVTLCLENVEWSTYNRPRMFAPLKARVPDLKGVLDIKQARISGYPYQVYLEDMRESIAYVHLSDVDEAGKLCLPGKGRLDLDELIKRLLDVGFDGALLIEAYEKDYQSIEELKNAYEYVQEKIKKYGR